MRNRDKSRERMGFAGTSPSWGDKRIRKRLEALFSRAKTARERADHRRFPVWPLTIRLPSKQAFFGLCAPECASGVASRETRGTALKAGWSGEYNRRCGRFEWRCREPGRDVGAGGTQPAGGAHSGPQTTAGGPPGFPGEPPAHGQPASRDPTLRALPLHQGEHAAQHGDHATGRTGVDLRNRSRWWSGKRRCSHQRPRERYAEHAELPPRERPIKHETIPS